jgi:hypothetical protein
VKQGGADANLNGAPFASPDRAAAIAGMKDFGLREFIELTGVGAGRYGIYEITEDGLTVRDHGDATQFTAQNQVALLKAEDTLTLKFPCSPEQFQEWYDATRGENGTSDFPLAAGFLTALLNAGQAARAHLGAPRPSADIIAAFKVKPGDAENKKWWDDRMRGAKKYELLDARASHGRAKQQSQWYPTAVAGWLIDKKHLSKPIVRRAMEKHFPDADTNFL